MRNIPSKGPSEVLPPRNRVGDASHRVIAVVTLLSAALIAALHKGDEQVSNASVSVSTATANDHTPDANNAEQASTVEGVTSTKSEVPVQNASLEKKVVEKAPLKPGKPTIAELPEGPIAVGTKVRLRAGGEEGGQEYILEFDENGQIIIDGKRYVQAAEAFRDIPFIGKKLMKTVPLKWSSVIRVTDEKGNPLLNIIGEPIDKSTAGESNPHSEADLLTMAANAAEGKLVKPLGKKTDKTTGFEVDVVWTIKPAKK